MSSVRQLESRGGTGGEATSVTLDVVRELFSGIGPPDFAIRLWDGSCWTTEGAGDPAFTLVFERPGTLRRLLRARSEAALAEAHLFGDVSIEGDILAAAGVGRVLVERRRTLRDRLRLGLRLLRLPRGEAPREPAAAPHRANLTGKLHSVERDRAAVTHHYDLSNRFYELFLDSRMIYSCAVFRDSDEDLDTAQLRKLDLICRKLRLREGDRLLDIGCGWGALIMHAAREYGAVALGITVSERQAELARRRIREASLDERCRVEVRDYRTLDDEGIFDRVASVGMFEHVGRVRAPEYFARIFRLLRPGGSYLHHAITASPRGGRNGGPTLASRYVFPDHELIPLAESLAFAAQAGFDIRDVEELREHYALTLRRWIAALEEHHDETGAEVGEATWRAWRLVFAGAAVGFETDLKGVAQVLMAKPRGDGSVELPLGRWDWYPRRA